MQLKKILVPVDGSEHAMRAAAYASDLVRLVGGEILLVHCHKPFPKVLGEPFLQKAIIKIKENADRLIQPYRELLEKNSIGFTERILEGPPWGVISDVARIEKCDLIVMGSRGCTDLEGMFLGSVTHRVLHSTPCPVLVVR